MAEENKETAVSSEYQLPNEELPELTLKNVLLDIYHGIWALIFDPFCNRIVCPIIVTFASIMGKIVIAKVPYTEIDFSTYMQQVELINGGELDYAEIYGDSGPIVYPAGHVQIYQFLYSLTSGGKDITTAQKTFGYLFTFGILLSLAVVTMTPNIPPWPLYLLIASKRVISIFVLRLFNDCFTTVSMIGVILVLQQASYWYTTSKRISLLLTAVSADLYSLAISVKMNALLYLPGFCIIVYFLTGENILLFLLIILIIPLIQIIVGWRFLLLFFNDDDAKLIRYNYLNNAFNFKRGFLFEWTINWNFVGEEIFTSSWFSKVLLSLHTLVLLFFVFTRYISPKVTGKPVLTLIKDAFKPRLTIHSFNLFINHETGPNLVLLVMSTTNVIGILFSRTLHYQFLSWYFWQLPVLLYMTNWNVIVGVSVWALHEYCWNVYPPSKHSSILLISILSLVLAFVWNNTNQWFQGNRGSTTIKQKKKD